MSAMKRWRGLRALVTEAIEHGSTAVERVHMATAARPFAILEQIPEVALPTRGVRAVHDATVSTVYGTIRLVNRAVGATVDAALAVAEQRERDRLSAEPRAEATDSHAADDESATTRLPADADGDRST